MDTEQYEEAVRDYEKVYQTEKTSGNAADPALSHLYLPKLTCTRSVHSHGFVCLTFQIISIC